MIDNLDNIDFYFHVWCIQLGFTQAEPWKIQQIIAQDMQTAAELFVKWFDERNKNLTFNQFADEATVFVQDWRGIIVKFKIIVEMNPVYIARRIT